MVEVKRPEKRKKPQKIKKIVNRKKNVHFEAWRQALAHFGPGLPPKKGTAAYAQVRAVYEHILKHGHPPQAVMANVVEQKVAAPKPKSRKPSIKRDFNLQEELDKTYKQQQGRFKEFLNKWDAKAKKAEHEHVLLPLAERARMMARERRRE